MTDIAIFDIDGTLADCTHRLGLIYAEKPNWPAFFDACVDDKPYPATILLFKMVWASHSVVPVLVTGRPDSHRLQTVEWLHKYDLYPLHSRLLMRKAGDYRADVIVKLEMLNELKVQGFNPVFSVDDRPAVVEMWRANGVPCFACDPTNWKKYGTAEGST